MAQAPQSLKLKKFQDIVDIDNGIFTKEYCYDCNETWKFNAKTQRGSSIEYETKFNADKDLAVSMQDTLKFKFPFRTSQWLWVGIKRSGDLKIHYDAGKTNIFGKDINYFSNLKTSTKFQQFAIRLGANYFGTNHEISARLGYGGCCQSNCLNYAQKYLYKNGNLFAGCYNIFRLDKLLPCLYEGILGYTKGNTKFYLQYQSPKCDVKECETKKFNLKLGTLTGYAIHTKGKYTCGYSFKYDAQAKKPCMAVATQYKQNDQNTMKAKLNCCLNLDLMFKHKFSDFITMKASTQLQLKQLFGCCMPCKEKGEGCCQKQATSCCSKDKKCCPLRFIPIGVEFELNI